MKINMQILREMFNAKTTIGKLFIDGKFFCWTLEDAVRTTKIKGETAIPSGNYRLDINPSKRFKRDMIQLLNVPGFDGIRIHTGNTAKDSEGCILVAKCLVNDNTIQGSMEKEVFAYVKSQLDKNNEVWLSIINKRI